MNGLITQNKTMEKIITRLGDLKSVTKGRIAKPIGAFHTEFYQKLDEFKKMKEWLESKETKERLEGTFEFKAGDKVKVVHYKAIKNNPIKPHNWEDYNILEWELQEEICFISMVSRREDETFEYSFAPMTKKKTMHSRDWCYFSNVVSITKEN